MSAQFIKLYEIGSDIPMISSAPPPKDQKKPLALTLTIKKDRLTLSSGIPSKVIKTFNKISPDQYDLVSLHDFLVQVKIKNTHEDSIIFEPIVDLTYDELIKIMDSVRVLEKTDEAIYTKDKDGVDIRVKALFQKIVFGNILS